VSLGEPRNVAFGGRESRDADLPYRGENKGRKLEVSGGCRPEIEEIFITHVSSETSGKRDCAEGVLGELEKDQSAEVIPENQKKNGA